ncbi:MAG: Osmosensitive channel histidine kinase KdpD [Labilithrix sp.]|nr:Osmosensitive channel histidine kinase KdpD [Labilithrix sp.]
MSASSPMGGASGADVDDLMSALEVVGDAEVRIEDVVDRESLEEMCRSVEEIFGINVRVYSADGALLVNIASDLEVCSLVNEASGGRLACGATVSAARNVDPGEQGDIVHACFTGLAYRIVSLDYEGRRVGRIVLGPFAPAGLREAPESLATVAPKLPMLQTNELLARVPRVKAEALGRIARHLKTTLELIIFSSHKAFVTSKLHLYSVREGYRAMEEKNERLEQALVKLREADRLKSNFLGTVSHELRTPLTSIIGYSEMLAEGIAGPLTEEQGEFLKTIQAKGEQLLALIMGLLDLSKLDSGTMPLRQAPLQIAPVLEEVRSTLAPAALKKQVALVLESDGTPCEIAGDPDRLRQVFLNLVENALKFTPKGGKVTLRTRVLDAPAAPHAPGLDDDDDDALGSALLLPVRKVLEIRVIDTGIGIPKAERAKVFEAFYQVDSSSTREYGGTGLGLSIVKRILDAHGGTIAIEGNDPTGTIFVVVLPSAQARRAALPSRVPGPMPR